MPRITKEMCICCGDEKQPIAFKNNTGTICGATHKHGWGCCREPNHNGIHEAITNKACARWFD